MPNGKRYPVYSVFYVTKLFVSLLIPLKTGQKGQFNVQAKWKIFMAKRFRKRSKWGETRPEKGKTGNPD